MTKKISIIIPAYNAEQYLANTLKSVFMQCHKNIEVIVINDGSKDNTENILLEIQKTESRLKIFSQENLGISCARNAGIELAKGEFIAFMDSDDYWEPSFLTKMLAKQKECNGNVIYSGYIDVSDKGLKPRISDFREQYNLAGYLKQTTLLHIGCLLIKKTFLDDNKLRFNINLQTGEDIVFICSLYCLSDAYSVPEYMYYYVHRQDSITHKNWTKQNYLDDLQAWKELECIIKETYTKKDYDEVVILIEAKIVYYKLRLLWLLLLSARYQELESLLNNKFLTYSDYNLKLIPAKYAGIRRKIIESKSRTIWKMTKMIHHRKVNLY